MLSGPKEINTALAVILLVQPHSCEIWRRICTAYANPQAFHHSGLKKKKKSPAISHVASRFCATGHLMVPKDTERWTACRAEASLSRSRSPVLWCFGASWLAEKENGM